MALLKRIMNPQLPYGLHSSSTEGLASQKMVYSTYFFRPKKCCLFFIYKYIYIWHIPPGIPCINEAHMLNWCINSLHTLGYKRRYMDGQHKSLNSPSFRRKAFMPNLTFRWPSIVINWSGRFRPDPARKLSAKLHDICHCCMYSEKLLMMDRGTVRNM